MDNRFDRVKVLQDLLRLVQILPCAIQVLQLELHRGYRNSGIDVGILRIGVVDFVCCCGKEGKAVLAVCRELVELQTTNMDHTSTL